MGTTGQDTVNTRCAEGRRKLWGVFLLPLVVTAIFCAIASSRYAAMPELIPTHWGANGVADDYGPKSHWSVFGPLLVGPGAALFLAFIAKATATLVPVPPEQSRWAEYQREGSYRTTILTLGIIATFLALLIGIVCEAAWRQVSSFTPWPVAAFVVAVLAVILVGYPAGQRWARRRAAEAGAEPTAEEAAEDTKWVAGGLYRDPEDPRAIVPKRIGQGVGTTLNIGSARGKAAGIALLVLVLAVPVGITGAALFGR